MLLVEAVLEAKSHKVSRFNVPVVEHLYYVLHWENPYFLFGALALFLLATSKKSTLSMLLLCEPLQVGSKCRQMWQEI
jgi:hypothetical protein